MKKQPFPPTRIWGAVWTDDGPVADVRDIDTREAFNELTNSADFRWWAICNKDDSDGLREGHNRGGCAPGKPCQKCQQVAATWWFEHGKRTKARIYRPCHVGAKRDHVFDSADWSQWRTHDREEALQHARAGGLPLVLLMDGHGHRLEWIGVAS
jgi:hypothetical protein